MNEVEKILRELKGAHQLTARQIAEELGVGPSAVSNWRHGTRMLESNVALLRELHARYMAGDKRTEGAARPDIDRDEVILRMHRRGDNLQEIADIFGLTRERIRQIVTARRDGN